ncbi:TolC family protein [Flavobacteriaceae bacterium]|jgi:outer membrane protein TolC|nr:TolC family protein [Flavobacteriaceae bacterium]
MGSIIRISSIVYLLACLQIQGQQVLQKSEAIALTLENNYGIKTANNNVIIAENNSDILNSGYLPTLSGNAGASLDVQNTQGQLVNGETRSSDGVETRRYNASVNLNYTLFDGLGRYYDYKRLKETYQLSKLQARETIENAITQLLSVYFEVAQNTENLQTLTKVLEISKERLTRANYQFEFGQSNKLSVLNAEVDINNDSINIITAKQRLISSKRDLNLVMGNALKTEFSIDTTVVFLLQLNKEELLSKLSTNNVNLLQIDKNINISSYDIKVQKSTYLPTLGLSGSYGWNESSNDNPLAFTIQNTNTGFSTGLNLTWNLFNGGSNTTRIKNAKINLENQELQKNEVSSTIGRNFSNAWDDYQNKLEIYHIQESNIITSKNNFDRTNEQFKIGRATSIEFRQAQINLVNAQLSKNSAKYQAKTAEILVLQISGELLNMNF